MISRRNNAGVLRIAPATHAACDKGVGMGHGTTYVAPWILRFCAFVYLYTTTSSG